ncbi:hypothetical protein ACP70R_008409 [Stipagrostis hirtigluma subsp. patula]
MATFWRLLLLLLALIVRFEQPLAAAPVSLRYQFPECKTVPISVICFRFFMAPTLPYTTKTCCDAVLSNTTCLCTVYNNRASLGYDVDKACSSRSVSVKARCSKAAEKPKKVPNKPVPTPSKAAGPCESLFVQVFVKKVVTFQLEDAKKNCRQKIQMLTTSKSGVCDGLLLQLVIGKAFNLQLQVAKNCGQLIDKVTTPRETQPTSKPGPCEKLFGLLINNLLSIQLPDIKNCVQKIDSF